MTSETDAGERPRVAVVTGAASGVGRATVDGLLADGFAVVALDLHAPADDRPSDRVAWIQGDITAEATWRSALEAVARTDPAGATCLVLCAGDVVVARFRDTAVDDFRRLFEVNVLGAVRGMHAVLPAMVARGAGAIAVVCSVDSLFAEDGLSAYATSKAALLQVVRSAALEHARDGLRINAVCPGAIDTALFRRALEATGDPEGERRAVLRRIPSGEVLAPDEVATVLRFLVSDAASGMSGAAVVVDGGLTATYDYQGSEA